jgi:hypothetical protein
MIVTVLPDAGVAMVTALLAILAAVNGAGLELAAYVPRRDVGDRRRAPRDRLGVFVQAGIGVFVVQATVVVMSALLGDRGHHASSSSSARAAVSAGGAAVATSAHSPCSAACSGS